MPISRHIDCARQVRRHPDDCQITPIKSIPFNILHIRQSAIKHTRLIPSKYGVSLAAAESFDNFCSHKSQNRRCLYPIWPNTPVDKRNLSTGRKQLSTFGLIVDNFSRPNRQVSRIRYGRFDAATFDFETGISLDSRLDVGKHQNSFNNKPVIRIFSGKCSGHQMSAPCGHQTSNTLADKIVL